jgi:hypothetical protein
MRWVLLLLEQLSSTIINLPILLISTSRPISNNKLFAERFAATFARIDSSILQVAPFSQKEVELLIDPFDPHLKQVATEIHLKSGGNAFYATHLVRLYEDSLTRDTASIGSNRQEDAARIIGRQLADLPDETKAALKVASAIGQQFPISLIAAALGISETSALETLEAAERARVIEPESGQFSFRHAILQELLYSLIDTSERARTHAALAIALQGGKAPSSSPAVVFDHLLRAHPIAEGNIVCEIGLTAGHEAIFRCAFSDAIRILESCLNVAANDFRVDRGVICDLMINLSRALLYSGSRDRAKHLLLEASDLAMSIQSFDRYAQCGLEMAPDFLSIEVGACDNDLILILKEALRVLPDDALGLRARVMARLSQVLQWVDDNGERQQRIAEQALDLAISSGDSGAIRDALAAKVDSLHGLDRIDEKLDQVYQLQDSSLSLKNRYAFFVQQTRLIAALLERGEIRRISIENDRYRLLANDLGLPQYRWYPLSTDSMLACLVGDIDRAEDLAAQYREIAGANPDDNFIQTYACQSVLREIERGRSKFVLPLAEAFATRHPNVLSWSAAVSWIQWDAGLEDAARESLRQFSESDIRKMNREPGGTIGLAALAETCAYLGDARQARFLFEMLAPARNRFASAGYGVAYFGSLARYSSLLAVSLKRYSIAEKLASTALSHESRLKAVGWRALAYVDLLRARKRRLDITIDPSDRVESVLSLVPGSARVRRRICDNRRP